MKPQRFVTLLTVFFLLASAAPSFACSVCFGETDSPMVQGLQVSVLFMVGVTYFVIIGGVATFFVLRFKARRLAPHETTTHS